MIPGGNLTPAEAIVRFGPDAHGSAHLFPAFHRGGFPGGMAFKETRSIRFVAALIAEDCLTCWFLNSIL